jgi:molecular chaperone HtpG
VKKINNYITKKVADKLHDLFKDNRKDFEEKWEHIGLFVKFGMISEDKFREKAKSYTLLQNIDNKFFTIEEYREHIKANQTDKNETLVALYATNAEQQHAYIDAAKAKGYDVLQMDSIIDSHFINHIEGAEEKFTFKRVDADPIDTLIEKDSQLESVLSKDEEKSLEELFKAHINSNSVTIQLKPLSPEDQPAFITKPEFMRRFSDMQAVSGQKNNMPEFLNLVLNTNHPAINKILKEADADKKNSLVDQVYDLAMLSQGLLKGEKLTKFIKRSVALID